jgi:hypothetical protein
VGTNKPVGITIEPIKAIFALPEQKAKENGRIVGKAVQKALQLGWFPDFVELDSRSLFSVGRAEISYRDQEGLCIRILNGSFNDILLNDGFAKALWGEETLCRNCGARIVRNMKPCCLEGNKYRCVVPAWQYHLYEILFLSEDGKCKYIKKFLD